MITGSKHREKISVFWFRRDLRLEDNTALAKAIGSGFPVLALFIFDTEIIDELPADDARISFIYEQLEKIHKHLLARNSSLRVLKGEPRDVWKELIDSYEIQAVYANKDYEPYALKRDRELGEWLQSRGVGFHLFKDQVVFEEGEIVKEGVAQAQPGDLINGWRNTGRMLRGQRAGKQGAVF